MFVDGSSDLFGDFEYYAGGKRQYETIKRRKSSMAGLAIVIIVAVVIVAVGSFIGIYAATQAVDSVISSSDVLIGVSVSGNDIIVEVFDSPKSDDVVCMVIVMEGYNIPKGLSTKGVVDDKIIYSGIAAGITGSKQVSFKAQFKDGSTKTVWMDTLRFT